MGRNYFLRGNKPAKVGKINIHIGGCQDFFPSVTHKINNINNAQSSEVKKVEDLSDTYQISDKTVNSLHPVSISQLSGVDGFKGLGLFKYGAAYKYSMNCPGSSFICLHLKEYSTDLELHLYKISSTPTDAQLKAIYQIPCNSHWSPEGLYTTFFLFLFLFKCSNTPRTYNNLMCKISGIPPFNFSLIQRKDHSISIVTHGHHLLLV